MFFRRVLLSSLLLCCVHPGEASSQQQVVANKYVVASGHKEASKVGLQVLKAGGNVVDAAIATSLALGVAEPYGSGLGGKLVMLYRDAETGNVYSIVALCTSPADLNPAEFAQLSSDERKYGYSAVGVPGLLAGLDEAYRRWGSMPWNELVEPAADLADQGIQIDATMRGMFKPKVKYLRLDDEASALYLVDGEPPPVGAVMKNADLAASLREIATGGADAFYRGSIAEQIVSAARDAGSPLSLEDFRDYRAEFGEPLEIDYHGFRIYSCPPPLTGGITVLASLECMEAMWPETAPPDEVEFTDGMGRCLQCLYPPISEQIADTNSARDSCRVLTSEKSALAFAEQAKQLNPSKPYQPAVRNLEPETTLEADPLASTSHLLVIDQAGNMVSLTQSLSLHFGASVVAPDTGILLNDSLSNFATRNVGTVNYVEAGKRARSTIAPIIVTRDQQPWLALGIPGGQRIPTTTIQLLWRILDHGESLDAAFAAPRFHLQRPLTSKQAPNVVDYEEDISSTWVEQLDSRGWAPKKRPRNGHYFGGGSAAKFMPDGTMLGVADPRRTNYAAGE